MCEVFGGALRVRLGFCGLAEYADDSCIEISWQFQFLVHQIRVLVRDRVRVRLGFCGLAEYADDSCIVISRQFQFLVHQIPGRWYADRKFVRSSSSQQRR